MTDRFVVGYDLETDQVVHISDQPRHYWRDRGYRQRETLVCALCYGGQDQPAGTLVPLVVAGAVGGRNRPHFRHPPGHAPGRGGHTPESVWHLSCKAVLAAWARTLANVEAVDVEWVTPDRSRRGDVCVRLADHTRVVFEFQSTLLTDDAWQGRHHDYQSQGIRDVWLWKPDLDHIPWIVAAEGEHLWQFDPSNHTVTLLVGEGLPKPQGWWLRDDDKLRVYGLHEPPTVNTHLRPYPIPLTDLDVTAQGIAIPDTITAALDDDHARQCELAARERQKTQDAPTPSATPAQPREHAVDTAKEAADTDDPVAAAIRRHYSDPDGRRILARRGIQLP